MTYEQKIIKAFIGICNEKKIKKLIYMGTDSYQISIEEYNPERGRWNTYNMIIIDEYVTEEEANKLKNQELWLQQNKPRITTD